MLSRIDDLFERITCLERELEAELNRVRATWDYHIEAGRVRFERDVRRAHRRLKQSIPQYLRESSIATIICAPLVYSMIVPIALLDLWISIFQAICFRIFGIALVGRSKYIVVDRKHLTYLNGIEKLNCVVLRVHEWSIRIRTRDRRSNGTILVSHSACDACPRAASALSALYRLR